MGFEGSGSVRLKSEDGMSLRDTGEGISLTAVNGNIEVSARNGIVIGYNNDNCGPVYIRNLESPTKPKDAANKEYVDNAINDIKNSSTKITIKVWEDED